MTKAKKVLNTSCSVIVLVFTLAACSASNLGPASSWTDATHHPAKPPKPHPGGGTGSAGVLGDVPLATNANVALGVPKETGGSPEILISRAQYVLSWDKDTRNVNWAAWELTAGYLGSVGRTNHFVTDPDLDAYLAANGGSHAVTGTDYQGSCFDRGHQVPSGDRTDTVDDNAETFVMSNMAPQTAWLNRTVWEHLEAHTRDLIRGTSDTFYIIAGPIYAASPGDIGPAHDIAVPAKEFKIVVKGGRTPTLLAAVIMPNVTSTGSDPVADNAQACADQHHTGKPPETNPPGDWQQYTTTVAAIEQEAGIDLSFLAQ